MVDVDEIKRRPLSTICENISSPVALNGGMLSKKSDGAMNGFSRESLITPVSKAECSGRTFSSDASSSKILLNGEGFDVQKARLSLKDGLILSPCSTPSRQQDRSYELESSLESKSIKPLACLDGNASVLTPRFLDDDIDESIFEQIDALCEQNPSDNAERKDCAMEIIENDSIIKSREDDISATNIDLSHEILKSEEISNSAGEESSGVKGLGKSASKLTKNMPEEFAKYIQSLNDRQQEAACSDISIPLVIVAGPGSGKVYSPHFFKCSLLFNDHKIWFICQTSTMVGRVLVLLSEVITLNECLS